MKIAMLNAFDEWGGAARAACRLHAGMRRLGVESQLLVQTKTGQGAGVVCNATPVGQQLRRLRPHFDLLPVRFYRNRPLLNFSPAWWPDRVAGQVADLHPDLVHLHWLTAGFVRLETLSRLHRQRRPLVWTLHDSWAFTGGCHVPADCTRYRQECGACPILGSRSARDLSRWIWQRKQAAWQDLDLTLVAPSRWLADCARSSALFRNLRVEVIPNGLDLEVFKPMDKAQARDLLGLPRDRPLILCGGMGIHLLANKGMHLLKTALERLAAEGWGGRAELAVVGSSGTGEELAPGFKVHYLGWLDDDPSLVAAYAAADLFVSPSLMENFPNTVLEAMACATPCVAFAQGGLPQLIDHGRTGYLAEAYVVEQLAEGMRKLLADDSTRESMARNARQKVEDEFALDRVCSSYLDLYGELLDRGRANR